MVIPFAVHLLACISLAMWGCFRMVWLVYSTLILSDNIVRLFYGKPFIVVCYPLILPLHHSVAESSIAKKEITRKGCGLPRWLGLEYPDILAAKNTTKTSKVLARGRDRMSPVGKDRRIKGNE